MRHYETLYIVHPALEAGRLKDTIQQVDTHLKGYKSDIVTTEVWGKKRLAYYIDKQKYGTYVLVQYKSDGTKNKDFHIELEHNPSILAYMTTKIDEDDIREQTEDLDTQLSEDKKAPAKEESSNVETKTEDVVEKSNPEPVTEGTSDDDSSSEETEEKGEE
jgi:small subunit ribosomal protein S6